MSPKIYIAYEISPSNFLFFFPNEFLEHGLEYSQHIIMCSILRKVSYMCTYPWHNFAP